MTDSEVTKNPLAVYEVSSRGCKFGVWCVVVSVLKVTEPVFFRRNVILTRYANRDTVIKNFLLKKAILHKISTIFEKSLVVQEKTVVVCREIFSEREKSI